MNKNGEPDQARGLGAADTHDDAEPGTPLMVNQKVYDRIIEILLRLDFTDFETGCSSTSKWIAESAIMAGKATHDWGHEVTGTLPSTTLSSTDGPQSGKACTVRSAPESAAGVSVNILNTSLVRKGKKPEG